MVILIQVQLIITLIVLFISIFHFMHYLIFRNNMISDTRGNKENLSNQLKQHIVNDLMAAELTRGFQSY